MNLKEIYQKVDTLKKQLDTLQPIKESDNQRLWKKFRLEWNFNSNHIEGNTLTYSHTELLLFFDQVTGDYTGREIEEMKAHDVAVKMVIDLAYDKERNLTEHFIRELNKVLLVRPFWKEAITSDGQPTRKEVIPGIYKRHPNSVRLENGKIFSYASPEETPSLMGDFITFHNESAINKEVHPLWHAAMMHYKLVSIHPFDDGNGRIARLLMNYVLLKNNLPPVIIKNENKKEYLMALNKADTGDFDAFILFIGYQLLWSLEISIKAAKGESIDEEGDLDKKIKLLKKEQETANKTIVKSSAVINSVITNTYISFIKSLNEKFNKFRGLFFEINWACRKPSEKSEPGLFRYYTNCSLDKIFETFKTLAMKGEEGHYSVCYKMERFNDEDDSFNASVVCEIYFQKKYFDIKVYIGEEGVEQHLIRLLNKTFENEPTKRDIEISFSKNIYNKSFNTVLINEWAEKVANELFEYIENKSNELNERRKRIE